MNWLEIGIQTQDKEAVQAVRRLFDLYGHGGAVQEQIYPTEGDIDPNTPMPTTVKTYLPLACTTSEQLRALQGELSRLAERYPLTAARLRELGQRDWANAWKAYFEPQRIGERLVVKLADQAFRATGEDIVIDLEPGMAFGTGLHPTTRMCLICLQERVKVGDRVLDMGTGSGILAVAAAKLGATSVLAVDNDPVAVEVARKNISLNGLHEVVEAVEGSLDPLAQAHVLPVDGITINILADVIADMMEQGLTNYLKRGGWLIAGGIAEGSEQTLTAAFGKDGMRVIHRRREAEWVTLCGIKERLANGS